MPRRGGNILKFLDELSAPLRDKVMKWMRKNHIRDDEPLSALQKVMDSKKSKEQYKGLVRSFDKELHRQSDEGQKVPAGKKAKTVSELLDESDKVASKNESKEERKRRHKEIIDKANEEDLS